MHPDRPRPAPHLSIEPRTPPGGAAPARRPVARALLVLTTGWLVLFSPQLVAHRVFVSGDATLYRRFPEYSRARWTSEHERTFWNPFVFLGVPATASLADQRPQFLPDALLDAYEALRSSAALPPLAGPLIAHLAGVLAMALLARALWGARLATMVWAGAAWALLPALLVPLSFGHDAQLTSAALIPVVLLLVHALFAASPLRAAWVVPALALVLGIQCLFGHPQIVALSAALGVAFALERALAYRRGRRLLAALGAACAGAMISASTWLPLLHYGALSVRGGAGGVATPEVLSFSQAWRDLLSLGWPGAVGFGGATYWGGLRKTDFPQFAGTLVCVFAMLAWPRRARRERGAVAMLAAFALLGAALSLGANLPALDGALRAALRPFAAFRVPVSWLLFTQLSLILLSALGLERIAERGAPRDAVVRGLQMVGAAGAFAVMTGFTLAWAPPHAALAAWAAAARPALAGDASVIAALRAELDLVWRGVLVVAAIALWLASRRARWAGPAIVAVLALEIVDLGSVSAPFLIANAGPASRLAPAPATALARAAAADPHTRAMPLDPAGAATNDWVAWRARCVTGVHGAVDRDWSDLMAAGFQRHYQALCAYAVRYTTVPAGTAPEPRLWSLVEAGTTDDVIRLTGARERAYFATDVVAPGDRSRLLQALLADDFRPERALADETRDAGHYPGSEAARVRWLEDAPDRLRLECDAADRAYLVVADPLLPGWTARLDGRRAPLSRVDWMLRGLPLPPGRHVVEMRYVPPGWAAGVALSRAGILLVLAAALALAGWRLTFTRGDTGEDSMRAA